jgi:hypothetical protein
MSESACAHIRAVKTVKTAMGSEWVHQRTCQECGGTRCCDSSPNRHASKHAAVSQHPVISSAEPGESWLYCYPDDAFAEN